MEKDYLELLDDIEKELMEYSHFLLKDKKRNLGIHNLIYYEEILSELKKLKTLLFSTLKIIRNNELNLIEEKIKYLLNDIEDKEKILNNLITILSNKKEFGEIL